MGFGIYVHWPFCANKCPYCDFNSHVRSAIDEEGFVAAILKELAWVRGAQAHGPACVETVFFGGGTPSLMQALSVERILDKIASLWSLATDLEVSLEANPASTEAERFGAYRQAGVNRLSLGIQALDDKDLKSLGRLHDVRQAKRALKIAVARFERVSFDLIYARPGQSVAAWRQELQEALAFQTEHLSLYQLTIEPNTPFALLHQNGTLKIPDDELGADLYEATQELTARAGLCAYEVSNHARPGAECRHNLIYWRYGDYAGVGPGAHGRLDLGEERVATRAVKLPERWRESVDKRGHGYEETVVVSKAEAAREHLLMNLRLTEGLDLAVYERRWGTRPALQSLDALAAQDLLAWKTPQVVAATQKGRILLNRVLEELL